MYCTIARVSIGIFSFIDAEVGSSIAQVRKRHCDLRTEPAAVRLAAHDCVRAVPPGRQRAPARAALGGDGRRRQRERRREQLDERRRRTCARPQDGHREEGGPPVRAPLPRCAFMLLTICFSFTLLLLQCTLLSLLCVCVSEREREREFDS